MKRGWVSLACSFALWACSERAPHHVEDLNLPEGVLASVGNERVSVDTVRRIAAAEGIGVPAARDLALKDALFAAAARAEPGLDDDVKAAERAAYGRALLAVLRREARDQGRPSDAEVAELTRERWIELDRPASARTAHAVVMVKKGDPEDAARKKGEALARAVAGIRDPEEFVRRAKTVDVAPFTLRAERLPPVTPDGRTFDPNAPPESAEGSRFDEAFSRAANALREPGDQSPLVRTGFGFHVILLEERLAEDRPSLEVRRELLSDVVDSRRAEKSLASLTAKLRESTPVEVMRSADELTALVTGAP